MDHADLRARAERWIADDPDPATRAEVRALLAQPDLGATDLADRFAGALEFGTAGLRGVLGGGSNRMNRAVVARATWALARELLETVPRAAERGVVVGGDARRMSRELSEDVAAILAAAGIRVVLFREPVPTPLVGFAVKRARRGGAAWSSRRATTRPSTTATRCTGRTPRRSSRRSTRASPPPSRVRRRRARSSARRSP